MWDPFTTATTREVVVGCSSIISTLLAFWRRLDYALPKLWLGYLGQQTKHAHNVQHVSPFLYGCAILAGTPVTSKEAGNGVALLEWFL